MSRPRSLVRKQENLANGGGKKRLTKLLVSPSSILGRFSGRFW